MLPKASRHGLVRNLRAAHVVRHRAAAHTDARPDLASGSAGRMEPQYVLDLPRRQPSHLAPVQVETRHDRRLQIAPQTLHEGGRMLMESVAGSPWRAHLGKARRLRCLSTARMGGLRKEEKKRALSIALSDLIWHWASCRVAEWPLARRPPASQVAQKPIRPALLRRDLGGRSSGSLFPSPGHPSRLDQPRHQPPDALGISPAPRGCAGDCVPVGCVPSSPNCIGRQPI